ncbi:hypothetical protein S7711_06013 [Stachybotrys chartarum IBT 7711]|uniref:VPS9 domain-containing protein n=1 Tax=Stachybotrys chartarum (strain CBS 109288 / IBT 7711) TaxID=1280523 RepID=A0A084B2U3_STACB|nr:hypothetical protein S7711_06013 [Stachybotrys chartarum IBT 7711]KFA49393.1 hypothetical protein S40293_08665 [Stachybotrys chartarum IBT 40293]
MIALFSPSYTFMASQGQGRASQPRPTLGRQASYTQSSPIDNDDLSLPRRAQTFHNGAADAVNAALPDAFETAEDSDGEGNVEVTRASIELDDLPIELITLTDKQVQPAFVESLSAKVHPTPPNVDKLSQLFQDFYALASSRIGTHINALASKQSRSASFASSTSLSTAASRLKSKAASLGAKDKGKPEAEQQMITADELADKKRARKALEAKRALLEEAVERRLCEGLYNRVYRHRSTQDEAQDDKLRSKTAALALVNIGPIDLGIDLGESTSESNESASDKTAEIRQWLTQARQDLVRMAESRYPLGKLNRLKAAHKSIVDTLAHFHPSASADEIMPMLIYTLITLPPEALCVISDVHFIQNFRWQPKLTGEAAYCLTNLEAAISFLETVDLSTLRADELPSGQARVPSQPGTPKAETFPPAFPQMPPAAESTTEASTAMAGGTKTPPGANLKPVNVLRNRRLSDLVNTPAQAFGAASDAVMNTADQGIKTISTSLGDSYKFLLGKLRESQESPEEAIAVPRTLDDARKLVSTPPPDDEDNASEFNLGASSVDGDGTRRPLTREDRVLSLIGGRRDPSEDSTRSGRSSVTSKKVLFAEESKPATTPLNTQNPAVLEQMRNLGNSFNPMARLTSMGMMRGFGRAASTPAAAQAATPIGAKEAVKVADGGDLATAFPDIAAALPPKEATKIAPPVKRFMELQNPGDLKLGEVLELLRDYRRLAGTLKTMGAFEDKE